MSTRCIAAFIERPADEFLTPTEHIALIEQLISHNSNVPLTALEIDRPSGGSVAIGYVASDFAEDPAVAETIEDVLEDMDRESATDRYWLDGHLYIALTR